MKSIYKISNMAIAKITSALMIVFLMMGMSNTTIAQPNAPTNLSASLIGIKSFKLTWVASTSADVTGYEVFKDGISFGTTTAAITNLKIGGLIFGTTYTMTVKAKNALGLSVASTALPVTTFPALQINTASTTPIIDGNIDAVWANAVVYTAGNITRGIVADAADLSGTFRLLSDAGNLYLLADVKDNMQTSNSTSLPWQNDGIEFFLDIGWQAPSSYGPTDFQYGFSANNTTWTEYKNNAVAGVIWKSKSTTDGYRVEVSIPWATIGGSGAADVLFGFDINIVDVDGQAAGTIKAKKAWYGIIDESYQFPNLLGVAKLTGSAILDTEAPSVPIGLSSSVITPTSFTLSWSPSTDNSAVTGYEIFKDGVSVGTTIQTSFNFANLTCANLFAYTVKAKDAAGNISAASAPLNVTTATCDVTPPSIPAGLAASNISSTAFTLSWTASTDNLGVTNYEIFRNGISVGNTAGTTFNMLGLTCATIYSITIKAKDAAGNASGFSAPLSFTSGICLDTQSPSAPTGLSATAISISGFTLNWAASTDNIGVTGYEVFRGGVSVGTTTATTINISALICERTSIMTVKAKDLAGNISVFSIPFNATTASCAVTYEAEDALRTGGTVATSYPGYTGTGFWTNVIAQGNAVEFTVTAATAGKKGVNCRYATGAANQTITLYVNGVNKGQLIFTATGNLNTWGNKIDSIQVTSGTNKIKYQYDAGDNGNINFDNISFNGGSIDIDAPTAPTGLSYSANTATGFTLFWLPSIDNVGVAAYEIFKDGILIGTTTNATTFDVTGLACGFYTMTVQAKDDAGNVSPLSAALSAVTIPCANANALYVWNGSTSATMDGTFLNPYKTIQQAANVVTPGKTIFVRKGVYKEEVLMKVDSVVYRTFNGEDVTVDGTDQLTTWTLQPGGNVYRTPMAWNAENANQLFVDKKMIYLARWPKQTSLDMTYPSDAKADAVTAAGNNFTITDNDFNEPAARWIGADIWVNLSHNDADGQGWTGKVIAIAGKTITVNFRQEPILGNIPWGLGENTQYYLFNPTPAGVSATGGVSALLAKGEWYKAGNNLFVRTFNDLAPNETTVGNNIVEAKRRTLAFHSSDPNTNRSSYTIKDFTIFACAIVTDEKYKVPNRNAEIAEDAHDIVIDGIKAKYISHFSDQTGNWQSQWSSNTGFVISGRNNIIKNCILQYAAGPIICVFGFGNKVLNNTILEANYTVTNSGALNTEAACFDCEIGFNNIQNTPMQAISYKGFKNSNPNNKGIARIHHNKIANAMTRTWDSGAIDAVALDGQFIRIDHNEIFTTTAEGKKELARYGIYCDFGGGTDVYTGRYIVDHNVVYNISGPLLINHIKQMNIYNNVLLSSISDHPGIANFNGGTGEEDTIRNNIMSTGPNVICCSFGILRDAVIENNIDNAQGAVANALFTDTLNHIYTLKASALDAIDRGVDFAPFNDQIFGTAVDLGAYEFGTTVWTSGNTALLNPRFLPNGGNFYDDVTFEILKDTTLAGTTIRYTLDGSEPTATSPVYTVPVRITSSLIVKARVFVNATTYSAVAFTAFTILTLDPNTPLRNPENPLFTKQGVIRNYYEYPSSANYIVLPNLNTLTPTKTDTIGLVGLFQPYREDNIILQFKGFIDIAKDGVYKFFTSSDDNSKFYIGDSLVVNNDYLQAATERNGSIGLKKGKHIFTTQFMETGGGQTFIVNYEGPGVTKKQFPASVLYYSNTPKADISISPAGATFLDEGVATITSSIPNVVTFYYTTDGTEPTTSSIVYNGPIVINSSLTIRAVAYIGTTKGLSTSATFTVIPLTGGPRAVLYPNPSNDGRFTIKFKNPGQGQVIGMNIFDARGRSVFNKKITITTTSRTQVENFNLPFLKPALYLVSLKTVSGEAGNTLNEEINLIVK